MTTLTSSATFTIGAGSAVVESAQISILPAIGSSTGKGRLIHPTLGTLDYPVGPDEWVNVDGDVIIAPTWATVKTLQGASNALWQGDIRDVTVQEVWIQELNVPIDFLRHVVAFWINPPDPDTGTPVQWWPNYTSAQGFQIIIENVTVLGEGPGLRDSLLREGITLSALPNRMGWVDGKLTITMRVLGRV